MAYFTRSFPHPQGVLYDEFDQVLFKNYHNGEKGEII